MPTQYIIPFAELRLKSIRNLTVRQSAERVFAIEGEFALASALDIFHRSLRFPIVERQNHVLAFVDCSVTLDRPAGEDGPDAVNVPRLQLGFLERHDAPTARYMVHVLVRARLLLIQPSY